MLDPLGNLCVDEQLTGQALPHFKAGCPLAQAYLTTGKEGTPPSLVMRPESGIGKMALEYEEIGEGSTDPQTDKPAYTLRALPLPIIHVEFEDLSQVTGVAASVGEAVEKLLVHGSGGPHPHQQILGLLGAARKHPAAATLAAAAEALHGRMFYGPYWLILPDPVRELAALGKAEGRVCAAINTPALPPGAGLLAQCTPDVCRLVAGRDFAVVRDGGKYRALCVLVPQVRGDCTGNYGVVEFTL